MFHNPPPTWPREVASPAKCQQERPVLWRRINELLPELTDTQKATVSSLVADTCTICFADDAECPCKEMSP